MNQFTFIETIKGANKPDRYGWVTANIGRYCLRTNGTEWKCHTIGTNRIVSRLSIVMAEWEKINGQPAPKATGKN